MGTRAVAEPTPQHTFRTHWTCGAVCTAPSGTMAVFEGELTPFSTPIPMAMYPVLALSLLVAGLIALAVFIVYEVSTWGPKRSLFTELAFAGAASALLGYGTFFLILNVGIYV